MNPFYRLGLIKMQINRLLTGFGSLPTTQPGPTKRRAGIVVVHPVERKRHSARPVAGVETTVSLPGGNGAAGRCAVSAWP